MAKFWARTAQYLSLAEVNPPPLRNLHAYWHACAGLDSIPAQRDLDPRKFADVHANIALVAMGGEPARARYLLVGAALKRLLGRDPTGLFIEQVYPHRTAQEIYTAFDAVRASRTPSFYQRDFQILGRSFGYWRLLLPLRLSGHAIERILIGIYPTSTDLRHAAQWQEPLAELERETEAEQRMRADWARTNKDWLVTTDDSSPV